MKSEGVYRSILVAVLKKQKKARLEYWRLNRIQWFWNDHFAAKLRETWRKHKRYQLRIKHERQWHGSLLRLLWFFKKHMGKLTILLFIPEPTKHIFVSVLPSTGEKPNVVNYPALIRHPGDIIRRTIISILVANKGNSKPVLLSCNSNLPVVSS